MSRSKFLLGGGALLASASGLGALAPAAFADGVPAGDLAYLRLLIASELLAVDFYGQAIERGDPACGRPPCARTRSQPTSPRTTRSSPRS